MTLDQWLGYIEQQHPASIELGLDRVRQVYSRMFEGEPAHPGCPVITVAGTNGKGSSVTLLSAILAADGYRVGSYTSPHLVHYNERVSINSKPLDDAALCSGFEAVENARGDTPLTYFEYGTLCAFWCFRQAKLDAWVLEVGLGGRLDAVNVIDADVALITQIGLDHQDWLGHDRETIGREKAGIMRPGKAVICSDPTPPASIVESAGTVGATLMQLGDQFGFTSSESGWQWQQAGSAPVELPLPAMTGKAQLDNAAGVIAALRLGGLPLAVSQKAVETGLRQARIAGRYQVYPAGTVSDAEIIVDVAHNEDSARVLGDILRSHPVSGRRLAVWSMYRDKDRIAAARTVGDVFGAWYMAAMAGARAASADELLASAIAAGIDATCCQQLATVELAFDEALKNAKTGDQVVVFGSFELAGGILAAIENRACSHG